MLSHRLGVIKCNEENNNIQLGELTYGLHIKDVYLSIQISCRK